MYTLDPFKLPISYLSDEYIVCTIKSHFGSPVGRVVGFMLSEGPCTLQDMYWGMSQNISFPILVNALIIMIHHNAVNVTPTPDKDETQYRYSINRSAVHHRMGYGRFLMHVESVLGHIERDTLFYLMKIGRGHYRDVIAHVKENAEISRTLEIEEKSEDDMSIETCHGHKLENVQEAFLNLLSHKYIHRVLPIDSLTQNSDKGDGTSQSATPQVPDSDTVGAADTPVKAGARRRAPKKLSGSPQSKRRKANNSSRAESASISGDSLLVIFNDGVVEADGSSINDVSSGTDVGVGTRNAVSQGANQKFTKSMSSDLSKSNGLYSIDSECLSFDICKKTIEDSVSMRFSNYFIIRYAIRCLLKTAKRLNDDIATSPVKFPDIRVFVEHICKTDGYNFNIQHLYRAMDALIRHRDKMVVTVQTDAGDMSYKLDWQRARKVIRRRLISVVIGNRFGKPGVRIWNLISDPQFTDGCKTKMFDDREIAETVLSCPEETRKILYQLHLAGLVRLHLTSLTQGLSVSPSSQSNVMNKHTFLFEESENHSYKVVVDNLYEMNLKLIHRKNSESERILSLHLRVQTLTEEESLELRCREYGEDQLERDILRLDTTISLLREL